MCAKIFLTVKKRRKVKKVSEIWAFYGNKQKNCVKNLFFAGILKVNDENSRIRIQDPDPIPDPLVRGMDPRIRIHPKMSWIRNTGGKINRPARLLFSFWKEIQGLRFDPILLWSFMLW